MPRGWYKKILLYDCKDVMTEALAQKVALRYAKLLAKAEFAQLIQWLSPKAAAAHKQFPRGRREFDTRTRVLRYNIAPVDYLRVPVEEAKAMMREGDQLMDVVNPKAYRAMKDVLEALRKRRIKFKMVKTPWDHGGSYIEAIMPSPKGQAAPEPAAEVDPRTWMGS
jgi:hypothetical protein